jgi:hypothetical protein
MPKPKDKPLAIPKLLVWEEYRRVAANKGAPGVDGQDLAEFEANLGDNLYKIWNRMSSGSYFPPPVRAVEIPKPHSPGVRVLGVPTVADSAAQTAVAMYLEPLVEPRFHPDSYGYRPKKSAHDALGACRQRCWKYDWLIDLDVQKFACSSRLKASATLRTVACSGVAAEPTSRNMLSKSSITTQPPGRSERTSESSTWPSASNRRSARGSALSSR